MDEDKISEVSKIYDGNHEKQVSPIEGGYVRLLDHWGGDDSIVSAARICYQSEDKSSFSRDVALLRRLMADGHGTPFEQAGFAFLVKMPIFVARQWMRHRIGWSYNERSLRYVTIVEPDYYTPPSLSAEERQIYAGAVSTSFDAYRALIDNGIKPETARGVLPLSLFTVVMMSCNVRALLHWLDLRMDNHAQWEHRCYAGATLNLCLPIMPLTFSVYNEYLESKRTKRGTSVSGTAEE